jgi:hypothetical protein
MSNREQSLLLLLLVTEWLWLAGRNSLLVDFARYMAYKSLTRKGHIAIDAFLSNR